MHYDIYVVCSMDHSVHADQARDNGGIFISVPAEGAHPEVYVTSELQAQLTTGALNAVFMSLLATKLPQRGLRELFIARGFRFGLLDFTSITDCYASKLGREQTRRVNDVLGASFGTNPLLRLVCSVRHKLRKPLIAA